MSYTVHPGEGNTLYIELPYEEMARRHPNEVADILQSWRRSRSKLRTAPPEDFAWVYETQEWADSEELFGEGENLTLRAKLWALKRTKGGGLGTGNTNYEFLEPLPAEVLAAWGRTSAVRTDPNPFRLPEGLTTEDHLRGLGFTELKT